MRLFNIFSFITIVFFTIKCANQVPPTGGPKDTTPPKVIRTIPENETVNFNGRKIKIYFDEFITAQNPNSAVFITPEMKEPPKVWIINKKILIKLPNNLQPNTTYVIAITPKIKDFTEGNPLQETFFFAFSTGNYIDTAKVAGKILSYYKTPEPNMTVMLFLKDSLKFPDFYNKKPLYYTTTNSNGEFQLKYIKPGEYYVFAVKDDDNSLSYSQIKEKIAIAKEPLLNINYQKTDTITLFSGTYDTLPPKVKKISLVPKTYKYKIYLTEEAIGKFSYKNFIPISEDFSQELLVEKIGKDSTIELTLIDTVGNKTDTIIKFPSITKAKNDTIPPKLNFSVVNLDTAFDIVKLKYNFYIPKENLINNIQLIDTSGNNYPIKILSVKGNYSLMKLPKVNPENQYFIQIDSSVQSVQKIGIDSTEKIPVKILTEEDYCFLKILINKDSLDKYRYFLYSKTTEMPLTAQENSYYLKPGEYHIKYYEDKNHNNKWDGLSLLPYKLPEIWYYENDPLKLRKGWSITKKITDNKY